MGAFEADLAAFRDWWATGGRRTRRDSTAQEYIRHVRNWHRWTASQPGGALTTPTVRSVRAYVAAVRPRSEWTAVEAVRALKCYSKWLAVDGAADIDPLASFEYLARPQTSKTQVAEEAAIAKMLAACSGTSFNALRDYTIIVMLRATGMRRNELAQMRWQDIDLAECTVHIPNASAKNGRGRTVAFDRDTPEALRRYYRAVTDWDAELMRDHLEVGRVFVGKMGPLTSNGIGQALQRRSQAAGVDLPAHSFRQGPGVALVARGALGDAPDANCWLGGPDDGEALHRPCRSRGGPPTAAGTARSGGTQPGARYGGIGQPAFLAAYCAAEDTPALSRFTYEYRGHTRLAARRRSLRYALVARCNDAGDLEVEVPTRSADEVPTS